MRGGMKSRRLASIFVFAGVLLFTAASVTNGRQSDREMTCGGGFTVSYASNGTRPGSICFPDSFNGALSVKADFRAETIRASIAGGAITAHLIPHPNTQETRWYKGGVMFSGEGSGAMNTGDGQFSIEIIVTGEEGGAWNIERDQYESEVKVQIRRTVQLSGIVTRDGKGRGRIFSNDGPCRMEGDWKLGTAQNIVFIFF